MSNVTSEERAAAGGHAGEPVTDEQPKAGTAAPVREDADALTTVGTGADTATGPAEQDTSTEKEDSGTGHPKPANWSVP